MMPFQILPSLTVAICFKPSDDIASIDHVLVAPGEDVFSIQVDPEFTEYHTFPL